MREVFILRLGLIFDFNFGIVPNPPLSTELLYVIITTNILNLGL